jgi:hypothetical protein
MEFAKRDQEQRTQATSIISSLVSLLERSVTAQEKMLALKKKSQL